MEIAALLLSFFFVVLFIYLLIVIAIRIVGPFEEALGNSPLPPRFVAADYFGLMLMLQLPLGIITFVRARRLVDRVDSQEMPASFVLIGVIGIGLAMVLWWRGVRVLTALEIRSTVKRVLFLGLLLPGILFLVVALFCSAAISIASIFSPQDSQAMGLSAFGVVIASVVGLIALKFLANWILAGANIVVKQQDSL